MEITLIKSKHTGEPCKGCIFDKNTTRNGCHDSKFWKIFNCEGKKYDYIWKVKDNDSICHSEN